MKRKTARDIFVESFRALAQTRSIDRITVREIAENCGYSTATFDRHFMDKYDLIVWDYARGIEQPMSRIGINVGFHFDSKNRRPSSTYEDMFYGYILGMDTFALGLIKAAKLIEDGRLDKLLRERYISYTSTEIGHKIRNHTATLAELADCAACMKKPENPGSGRQEMLEKIMNEVMFG